MDEWADFNVKAIHAHGGFSRHWHHGVQLVPIRKGLWWRWHPFSRNRPIYPRPSFSSRSPFQLSNNRNGHQGIWVDKLRGKKELSRIGVRARSTTTTTRCSCNKQTIRREKRHDRQPSNSAVNNMRSTRPHHFIFFDFSARQQDRTTNSEKKKSLSEWKIGEKKRWIFAFFLPILFYCYYFFKALVDAPLLA